MDETGPVPLRGPKLPSTTARSPLKTAMVIVVIGFAIGGAVWFLGDDSGMWSQAAVPTPAANSGLSESVIQYAEAILSGETEERSIAAATGTTIAQQLGSLGHKLHDDLQSGPRLHNRIIMVVGLLVGDRAFG